MEPGTKVIGLMTNSMDKEHFIIMKVTFSKAILKMEKPMATVSITVKMEHNLKEIGTMIKQWEKEPYIIPKVIFM